MRHKVQKSRKVSECKLNYEQQRGNVSLRWKEMVNLTKSKIWTSKPIDARIFFVFHWFAVLESSRYLFRKRVLLFRSCTACVFKVMANNVSRELWLRPHSFKTNHLQLHFFFRLCWSGQNEVFLRGWWNTAFQHGDWSVQEICAVEKCWSWQAEYPCQRLATVFIRRKNLLSNGKSSLNWLERFESPKHSAYWEWTAIFNSIRSHIVWNLPTITRSACESSSKNASKWLGSKPRSIIETTSLR